MRDAPGWVRKPSGALCAQRERSSLEGETRKRPRAALQVRYSIIYGPSGTHGTGQGRTLRSAKPSAKNWSTRSCRAAVVISASGAHKAAAAGLESE